MKLYLQNHIAEIASAVSLFFWGAILVNPFIDYFERYPNFSSMARHAREEVWGGAAMLFGLLVFAGNYLQNKPMRIFGISGIMGYRVFTLLLIGLQTNFTNAGTADYIVWVLIAFYALYRINDDA